MQLYVNELFKLIIYVTIFVTKFIDYKKKLFCWFKLY
mgnify:CR=1 FL=1